MQRRKAFIAQVADHSAHLAQAVDQVADRPLMHARHARQLVASALQRQRGGQRADRGAGIAHEELGRLVREIAAGAGDNVVVAFLPPRHAERAQRLQHHAGVVGIEQIAHAGLARGQCGQQQHAVGDALGARQPDGAVGAGQGA
ncbi:hypothetical protein D9M72_530500 [compost metagenome]